MEVIDSTKSLKSSKAPKASIGTKSVQKIFAVNEHGTVRTAMFCLIGDFDTASFGRRIASCASRWAGRRVRLSDGQRRLAGRAKLLGRRIIGEVATIVTPETLLAWHRKLIEQKYDGTGRRQPGRPHTPEKREALVVRMAQKNRDWGYERIQGALSNLGYTIGRKTVAEILRRHGVEPGPKRSRKTNLEAVPEPVLGADRRG